MLRFTRAAINSSASPFSRFLLQGFGALLGFACIRFVSFKPCWPLALAARNRAGGSLRLCQRLPRPSRQALDCLGMKAPICFLCNKDFGSEYFHFRTGGSMVQFADFEPLPEGRAGHPHSLEWFCNEHVQAAQALAASGRFSAL